MERLRAKVSELIIPSVKIVDHSEHTQNMTNDKRIVLWNRQPTLIAKDVYEEFSTALKKKGGRSYMYNNYLSHTEFATALLSASAYGLNHEIIPKIPDKTFASTWRAIDIISQTSTDAVVKWIDKFRYGRNAISYCNTFGIPPDNSMVDTKNDNCMVSKEDEEILNSIDFRPVVIEANDYMFGSYLTCESVVNDLYISHYSHSHYSEK